MRYGKVFGGIATFGKRVVWVGNLGGGGVGACIFNLGNFGGSRRALRFVGKRFSNNSVYGGAVRGFRGGGNVVFVICAVVNKVNSPRPFDFNGAGGNGKYFYGFAVRNFAYYGGDEYCVGSRICG